MLTSWRNTNPEIPATNSARKTSDRNMAYYGERKYKAEICLVCIKPLCAHTHARTHTHSRANAPLTTINCSIYWISDSSLQDRGQSLFSLSCDLRLINQHPQHSDCHVAPHPSFCPLTSFSIHGLPLQVAKHPNRPKTIMTIPVPMRTYGALVELSAIREIYGPSINFPHTPTASRMAPVI